MGPYATVQRWRRALRDAQRAHAVDPTWQTLQRVRHCETQLRVAEAKARVYARAAEIHT